MPDSQVTNAIAYDQNFALLESMGFLRNVTRADGRKLIIILGNYFSYFKMKLMLPSLFNFISAKLEAAAQHSYSILYVHTDCSYAENSPGVVWLWKLYGQLPKQCQDNLEKLYVLHPNWLFSFAAGALCPWLAPALWKKMEYLSRADFLQQVSMNDLELPNFVLEHEQDLAKHPWMDYGLAADSQETPLPHISTIKQMGQ